MACLLAVACTVLVPQLGARATEQVPTYQFGDVRMVDTRTGLGGFRGKIPPGATVDFQMPEVGTTDAADMSAVALNLTVTEPTASSYLTVWPAGTARPTASNLNFRAGQTVANLAFVRLGLGGRFSVYNNAGSTHLVVDIQKVFQQTSPMYRPITPTRLLDTRDVWGSPIGFNSSIDLQVPPMSFPMEAVVVNITATNATESSYLTAESTDRYWGSRPLASNLNFGPGDTVANLAVVYVNGDGEFGLYNANGSVDVIVDVVGAFVGLEAVEGVPYEPLSPHRILDTRDGTGGHAAPVGHGGSIDVQATGVGGVPANGVAAVAVNLTVTNPTAASYLLAWPSGHRKPAVSNVNFRPGETVANVAIVFLGTNGKFTVYNNAGSADVIADVVGWYPDAVAAFEPREGPDSWEREQLAVPPAPRSFSMIAYDRTRGETVLFGGNASYLPDPPVFGNAADTWIWDGRVWTQRRPVSSPAARSSGAMAADETRGNVVLFGGWGTTVLNDTWTWDGATWTQRLPTRVPPARSGASMAYDPATGRVLLFGGMTIASTPSGDQRVPLNDTWEWDGVDWTEQAPALRPPSRWLASIAAFPPTDTVVLFGGETGGSPNSQALGDTWVWDGSNWQFAGEDPSGNPTPHRRLGAAMAYDGASRLILISGLLEGSTNGYTFPDEWLWDGNAWGVRHEGSYPCSRACPPGPKPGARWASAAAEQPGGGVVLFSGAYGQSAGGAADTWTWLP
jgi:hypothetical protein